MQNAECRTFNANATQKYTAESKKQKGERNIRYAISCAFLRSVFRVLR
jgi:hypothetical protein